MFSKEKKNESSSIFANAQPMTIDHSIIQYAHHQDSKSPKSYNGQRDEIHDCDGGWASWSRLPAALPSSYGAHGIGCKIQVLRFFGQRICCNRKATMNSDSIPNAIHPLPVLELLEQSHGWSALLMSSCSPCSFTTRKSKSPRLA